MAEILRVTANVISGGDVSADLEAMADEQVRVVRTVGPSCPKCVANAESDDPQTPPLHPHCDCVEIITTVRELIEKSV